MYLKFIKTHISGTKKGNCLKISQGHGKKMVADKVCVEIEEEEYNEYINAIKEAKAKVFSKKVQPLIDKEVKK